MKEKIIEIAEHYGLPTQSKQAIEECAELIQALSKLRRCKYGLNLTSKDMQEKYEAEQNRKNLIEEVADVTIMLEQISYLLNIRAEVTMAKTYKVNRQLERIEDERIL